MVGFAGRAVDPVDVHVDLGLGLVALVIAEQAERRIGEPDRAVRFHDDVVRRVEPLAVEASPISTVIEPSYSVRMTRRPPCSQVTRRPWRSRVLPLAKFDGLRKTLTAPVSSSHLRMRCWECRSTADSGRRRTTPALRPSAARWSAAPPPTASASISRNADRARGWRDRDIGSPAAIRRGVFVRTFAALVVVAFPRWPTCYHPCDAAASRRCLTRHGERSEAIHPSAERKNGLDLPQVGGHL